MTYSSKRRSGGFNRGGSANRDPQENIAVVVDEIVIADPKKSNWEEDHAKVRLLHDAFGMTAEFDEIGAPLTEATVRMTKPREGSRRRDMFKLAKPVSGGAAMGPGSIVFFEKAYFDKKAGDIKANFAKGGPTAEQQGFDPVSGEEKEVLRQVLPATYTLVRNEFKRDGEPSGTQQAYYVNVADAAVVTNDEELTAAVQSAMDNCPFGQPGFMLLARGIAPEGEDADTFAANIESREGGFSVIRSVKQGEGDDATWVLPTAEEAVKAFFEKGNNEFFSELWGGEEAANWQFEVVPFSAVNQGPNLTPSKAESQHFQDNANDYRIYAKNVYGEYEDTRELGFCLANSCVQRMDGESDYWFGTYQKPTTARPQMFMIPDLPTPNMADYHVTAVMNLAAEHGLAKKGWYDQEIAPTRSNDADQEQGTAPKM